jgi:hypothetical protein
MLSNLVLGLILLTLLGAVSAIQFRNPIVYKVESQVKKPTPTPTPPGPNPGDRGGPSKAKPRRRGLRKRPSPKPTPTSTSTNQNEVYRNPPAASTSNANATPTPTPLGPNPADRGGPGEAVGDLASSTSSFSICDILTLRTSKYIGTLIFSGQSIPLTMTTEIKQENSRCVINERTQTPRGETIDTSTIVKKSKIIGFERVTVPAGSFDAYKVKITGDNENTTQVVWISNESRQVVKISTTLPTLSRAEVTFGLIP